MNKLIYQIIVYDELVMVDIQVAIEKKNEIQFLFQEKQQRYQYDMHFVGTDWKVITFDFDSESFTTVSFEYLLICFNDI